MTDKKKAERTIDTGGGAYFEGKIDTGGGDFVGGNQNKVTLGNVSGSTVVVGSGNTVTGGNQAGTSAADLAGLVAEMRCLLPQAQLQPRVEQVIDGEFKAVEEELAQPQPAKALVLPGLKKIGETLALAAGAGEAISKLAPMIEKAIQWAAQVLK
jgi:hypothetical protein